MLRPTMIFTEYFSLHQLFYRYFYLIQHYKNVLMRDAERDDDGEPQPAGLCFWALFQAVGITCVATIICRSVLYSEGYFDTSFKTESTSITKEQYANWHYSLTIIGFVYLYANCKYFRRWSHLIIINLIQALIICFKK